MKNISHSADTYDLYIDGTIAAWQQAMRNTTGSTYTHLENVMSTADAVAYIDEIFVAKHTNPEPSYEQETEESGTTTTTTTETTTSSTTTTTIPTDCGGYYNSMEINVTENSGATLTNYVVEMEGFANVTGLVWNRTCIGNETTTKYDFYSWPNESTNGYIHYFVEIPTMPASETRKLYVYYNNTTAVTDFSNG